MSLRAAINSSGESNPRMRASAGFAVMNLPSGVVWKIPSPAFSKISRYFRSAWRNASAARLRSVIFRSKALSSLHLLQEKIARAKAKKTRTAATSFTCQELYRADHAANLSKESKRTATQKTTTAATKVIARSFQTLLLVQVLGFGTLMPEAIRSKKRIITNGASWKRRQLRSVTHIKPRNQLAKARGSSCA